MMDGVPDVTDAATDAVWDEQGRGGGVEWLDLGPARPPGAAGRPPATSRWLLVAIPMIVIAVVVVGVVNQSGRKSATAAATPSSAATPATPGPLPYRAPFSTGAPVTVTELGHPILNVPPTWDLYGRGPYGVIVRIELAAGRITQTRVPRPSTTESTSFVPTPTGVLVQPPGGGPGYFVPDGRPVVPSLPGALAQAREILAGPDRTHVWMRSGDNGTEISLVDLAGRPTGTSFQVPSDGSGAVSGDGAGGLLLIDYGGAYRLAPDGPHRITPGALIAGGPTRWLAAECDDRHRCALVVIDRGSGSRRNLTSSLAEGPDPGAGIISPDGSAAVLQRYDESSAQTLSMFNLDTGADATLPIPNEGDLNSIVWSPDSRYVFIADLTGHIFVVDRRTSAIRDLELPIPDVTQLAFRNGS
jgi:hypothetical protein